MDVGDKVRVIHGEMYDCTGEVLEVDRYDIALVKLDVIGLNGRPSFVTFRFYKNDLEIVDKA